MTLLTLHDGLLTLGDATLIRLLPDQILPDFLFWGTTLLYVLVLVALMLQKWIAPSITILSGLFLAFFCGFTDFYTAAGSINLEVLTVVSCLMICAGLISESGIVEYVVIAMTRLLKGNLFFVLFFLFLFTLIFSAFLGNIITILLMIPLAIIIVRVLHLPVEPILMMVLVSANLGGAGTMIGGIPNMILCVLNPSQMSFGSFLIQAAPCVLGMGALFALVAAAVFASWYNAPLAIRSQVNHFRPAAALGNLNKMYPALGVFLLMILTFLFHRITQTNNALTAILGLILILAIYRPHAETLVRYLRPDILVVLIGFFILTSAMLNNGVVDAMTDQLLSLSQGNLLMISLILLWGTALIASVVDSIPLALILSAMLNGGIYARWESLFPGGTGIWEQGNPLIWAVLFGLCLGGGGTLIGAPSNLLLNGMARANGYPIPARRFFFWGFPIMILELLICSIYLWARFLTK